MSYFNTDLYETKREIVKYSKDIAKGLSKSEEKFIMDMFYGLNHS